MGLVGVAHGVVVVVDAAAAVDDDAVVVAAAAVVVAAAAVVDAAEITSPRMWICRRWSALSSLPRRLPPNFCQQHRRP